MKKDEKNIKLIALDMDGTLLNDDYEVSHDTQAAIKKALDENIDIVLSTGRWLEIIQPYAELLNLNSYIITVNGGQIWAPDNKLLEQYRLDHQLVKDMWHIGKKLDLKMWLVSHTDVYFDGRPDDFTTHEWLKFSCHSTDVQKLVEMRDQLMAFDVEITNSLPTNLEVNPRGVDKASALQVVCYELGITMDQVMSIGDSLNDIKMIKQSGIGIAMGNAQHAVKQVADAQTDTNNKNGVGQAILKYAL